ncbi:MAG: cation transporter dimerization domain-containing protein, partial [Phycisphaerae bacterium]
MSEGYGLIRESFRGLMDEMDPKQSRRINEILQEAVAEGRLSGFHQLRCRQIHKELWIEVHVLVPGELRTDEAHERVLKVEKRLIAAFPEERVQVLTHVEPENHELAHPAGDSHAAHDPLASIGE